jgi:macrolide-specific efflux system membrane fusion protein
MKLSTKIISALVGVGLVTGAVYATQRSSASTAPVEEKLRYTVKSKDLVIEVVDTGKVQPKERIEIKSKVAGQVARVAIVEGQKVAKGERLLELDPTDYERDVARADADVAQAKNALELAELTLERKKKGLEARGVAQVDVDIALNEVKAKKVAVKSADVALATAQDRLRYTRIGSPIDGTVIELGIQQGEVVTPGVQQTFEGRPLLVIGDLSTLIVRAELNQIDVAKIALNQTVSLSFDALPDKKITAKVTKIAPAAVKQKNKDVDVFPVEATLDIADPAIKPGMTADVRFLVETKPSVLAVPFEAVLREEGKAYVTKLVKGEKEEKKEKLEVELGARNDRELEVKKGVAEGDVLFIDPASAAANEVKL